MESWILYGLVAAFFIACRDMFTKHFTKKYTTTEHLLYYYLLCGVFIGIFALYKHLHNKEERVRCIDTSDIWKYALFALLSIAIISPCEVLSLKHCKNPGQSKSIINLSTLFVFILAVIFLQQTFSMKQLIGVILTICGVYLVVV
jgi:uncharacterized membrane protein